MILFQYIVTVDLRYPSQLYHLRTFHQALVIALISFVSAAASTKHCSYIAKIISKALNNRNERRTLHVA